MRVFDNRTQNDAQDETHELQPVNDTALVPRRTGGMDSASDTHVEKRVKRKLDFILLPFLAAFFLVNSLDRSNIGNSETANFTKDAGLRPEDLNISVSLFFATFVALQPLGAALGRKYGMRRWVPTTMLIWGLLTALHIWVRAAWQLYLLRILIGALEAGFYPTAVAYLASFYTRYEYAKRLGVFYGQYAIASAVGGVLAFVIFSRMPPTAADAPSSNSDAWKPWQILFLLEGWLTIAVAIVGFFYLPWGPEDAWFFTPEESAVASKRIVLDRMQSQNPPLRATDAALDSSYDQDDADAASEEARGLLRHSASEPPSRVIQDDKPAHDSGIAAADLFSAFTDWKVWFLLVVNILSSIPAAAFTVFLPLVMKELGVSPRMANLMVAPPFLVGACFLWFFTWWSDRRQDRFIPILWGLSILLLGLTGAVMFPVDAPIPRFAALCVLMGGGFVASPLTVAWLSGNIDPPGKRAVALGINGWGNLAGVFSSLLFSPAFRPDYTTPFFVTFALVSIAFLGFWLFRRLLIQENMRRDEMLRQMSNAESLHLEQARKEGPLEKLLASAICKMWPNCQLTPHGLGDNEVTYRYGL